MSQDLFYWSKTPHVSDGLSVNYQELIFWRWNYFLILAHPVFKL